MTARVSVPTLFAGGLFFFLPYFSNGSRIVEGSAEPSAKTGEVFVEPARRSELAAGY
jgi:hypothetical protein